MDLIGREEQNVVRSGSDFAKKLRTPQAKNRRSAGAGAGTGGAAGAGEDRLEEKTPVGAVVGDPFGDLEGLMSGLANDEGSDNGAGETPVPTKKKPAAGSSIFDRLSDEQNFTGVKKHARRGGAPRSSDSPKPFRANPAPRTPRSAAKAAAASAADSDGSRTPVSGAVGGEKPQIFNRLTDPTFYSGTHRHRFDPKTGKGRGADGRAPTYDRVVDLSLLTRSPASTPAGKMDREQGLRTASGRRRTASSAASGGDRSTAAPKSLTPKKAGMVSPGVSVLADVTGSGGKKPTDLDAAIVGVVLASDEEDEDEGRDDDAEPELEVLRPGASIFDKLTDSRQYTGAHKHRFDQKTGQGKGLRGRDSVMKGAGHAAKGAYVNPDGTVHDLSQIVRPGFYGGKSVAAAAAPPAEGVPPKKVRPAPHLFSLGFGFVLIQYVMSWTDPTSDLFTRSILSVCADSVCLLLVCAKQFAETETDSGIFAKLTGAILCTTNCGFSYSRMVDFHRPGQVHRHMEPETG